uniref:Tryptase beta 2 n=1 Tax=Mus musculus TaxID=10090 RepID=A0AAA9WUV3_MOUSE
MLKRLLLLLWALSLLASLVYSAPRPANQRVGIVGGHEASESKWPWQDRGAPPLLHGRGWGRRCPAGA